MGSSPLAIASLCAILCFSTGCASLYRIGRDDPADLLERRAKLFRTQVGNDVTLQWDSEPGVAYTVVYTGNLNDNQSWRALEGFERIFGDGSTLRIAFPAPIPGRAYYRLLESPTGR